MKRHLEGESETQQTPCSAGSLAELAARAAKGQGRVPSLWVSTLQCGIDGPTVQWNRRVRSALEGKGDSGLEPKHLQSL